MNIKELTKEEFDNFAKNHVLGSFYQSSAYASLMEEEGYNPIFVGGYKDGELLAGALILSKTISLNVKYGYSPRGFLVDYFDKEMLSEFTKAIKTYFSKKGFAFIKINPIITLSVVNKNNGNKTLNSVSSGLVNVLSEIGYKKLKDNLYFESILPRFNPIINLGNFSCNSIDPKQFNKINKLREKGLSLKRCDMYAINDFYEFVQRKSDLSCDFYKTLYKLFSEKDMIDIFLVNEDYHDYLHHLQEEITVEEVLNEKINKILQLDANNKTILNEKMESDKNLNDINEEIASINQKIQSGVISENVAGAMVIKYNGVATIFASGFNKHYNKLLPNHFMHYYLLDFYKEEGFKFFDLNGITGDFSSTNPYKGLNDFKNIFNPVIYEYIGEFDLVINNTKYSLLLSTKALQKEFTKKGLKSTNS